MHNKSHINSIQATVRDLKQQIVVNASYDFIGETKKGTPKEKHVFIGNLNDIVKIHYTYQIARWDASPRCGSRSTAITLDFLL